MGWTLISQTQHDIIVSQYLKNRLWRRFRVKDPGKKRFWKMMSEKGSAMTNEIHTKIK